MVRGAHQKLDVFKIQELAVDFESLNEFVCVLAKRQSGGTGVADGLVIHVGQVHHLHQLKTAILEMTPQDILKDEGAVVANVPVVVHRGPASVNAHMVSVERMKLLHAPG